MSVVTLFCTEWHKIAAIQGRWSRSTVWHAKCYFGVNEAAMRRQLLIMVALALSAAAGKPPVAVAQETKAPEKQKKQTGRKAQENSLTGCVDQQDGQYVLIQEESRSLIAHLEADGFPMEGFAKHVGHKVTVRGTSNASGAGSPVFKVQSVAPISDTCGPQG